MSIKKRILLSLITLFICLVIIEGSAQIVWQILEYKVFLFTKKRGEEVLRNDKINFIKQADGVFGFVLRPNFNKPGVSINQDGFSQREVVPIGKTSGVIRLAAVGESTTQGHNVDRGNYPIYLRNLISAKCNGCKGVEMINAGVPGWTSDQVALWAERKVGAYKPDIVVLYTGWNDFQSYDPLLPPPSISFFDRVYRKNLWRSDLSVSKAVVLATSVFNWLGRKIQFKIGNFFPNKKKVQLKPGNPRKNYRFYLISLDRIVKSFQPV